MRRLYREGERAGAFRLSPFDAEGSEEFLDWLNEPALEAATPIPISRFWFDAYREREDLQAVFPDLVEDVREFLRWIEGYGHEMGDVRGLMPDSADTAADLVTDGALSEGHEEPWGVNVAGFLQSELGIAEAARGLICGLDAAHIPVLPLHGHWRPSSRQEHVYAMLDTDAAAFPINIVCVNADILPQWAARAGEGFFSGRYTIGLWWWEVLAFPPEWLRAFELVDEVWVASQHVADALMPVSSVPVTKVTMPVSAPPTRDRSRLELGLPEGFLFMFLFDYHSVFERKNPLAAIEAFKRAFPAGSGAKLAIKSINHEHHPHAHERLLLASAEHPDIHLIDCYVTASDKNSMIASADCYVSLHRAEGFGLTPAEALCLGKPVIATRYGGNLEFMNDRNSWLVDYELAPIGPGHTPYPADGEWADPDVEQAAGYMRAIFEDPGAARERALRGAADMRSAHSPQAAGHSMRQRLEHVHSRRARWGHRARVRDEEPDFGRLTELVTQGPRPSHRSSIGRLLRPIRRLLLRLIKPFTAYQQMVNSEALKLIRTIAETSAETHDALRAERLHAAQQTAAELAELRRQAARTEELAGEVDRARVGHPESANSEANGRTADQVKETLTELGG